MEKPWIGGIMKLSIEAKVAASVAAGFVALTVGVIAQGSSGDETAGRNGFGPTNSPKINTYMAREGYDSLLPGRANTKEDKQ
jgi:hypothetical protein